MFLSGDEVKFLGFVVKKSNHRISHSEFQWHSKFLFEMHTDVLCSRMPSITVTHVSLYISLFGQFEIH